MPFRETGAQEPRIRVLPSRDDFDSLESDGADAAELAGFYGLQPDPWQRDILDVWLARDPHDMYVCTSCGLSVPRQNGKNAVLEMRELYGLAVVGEKILHTAHRVDTARKAFLRLASFFENPEYPELMEMVVCIRRTNGQESITLNNGGAIEFSSRVNGGARGSTYDLVVFDEAQELTDDQMEAIMSTMAAAPLGNRQLIFTGTPPSPVSPGTVFRRRRESAISGKDERMSWHEWSVEEIGDTADRSRWYATNPALGIRLDEEFTETEHNTLTTDGFARERLGWWSDEAGVNAALSKARWEACAITAKQAPNPDDRERIAYGVKFTPDGASMAVSAAVRHPERKTLVECIEFGLIVNGINRIAEWLVERKGICSVVVIDGKSHTAALVQKLVDSGFPRKAIRVAHPDDVIAAASMLQNAVEQGEIVHVSPTDLDKSAVSAQRRTIGSNGGWGFGSGTFDCAPIESVSLAHWGVVTTKRNPRRKMRVG